MAGWHHRVIGHEFEQALKVDGERHRSLMCCIPWGSKEWETTVELNNNI